MLGVPKNSVVYENISTNDFCDLAKKPQFIFFFELVIDLFQTRGKGLLFLNLV